jgi:hypothetical protein
MPLEALCAMLDLIGLVLDCLCDMFREAGAAELTSRIISHIWPVASTYAPENDKVSPRARIASAWLPQRPKRPKRCPVANRAFQMFVRSARFSNRHADIDINAVGISRAMP